MSYPLNSVIEIPCDFFVDDVLTDPTSVKLSIAKPKTGSDADDDSEFDVDEIVWPAAAGLRKDVGQFLHEVMCDRPGKWYARWEGTGSATAVLEQEWIVRKSPIPESI